MKITLIHGEDTAKARQRFSVIISELKKRGWEVVTLIPDKKQKIIDRVSIEKGFFGSNTLYVIEEITKFAPSEFSDLIRIEKTNSSNILLFHNKIIPPKLLSALPKSTHIELFDLPKILFIFLDSIVPNNSKKALDLLHKLLELEAVEFTIAMFSRHLRDLIWVKVDPTPASFPSWKFNKLKSQSSKFSKEKLESMIDRLSNIDIKAKTTNTNLNALLDLFLIEELE